MAKQLRVVKADPREERGKGPASRMRAAGRVPAVIYVRGAESRSVSLARGDMERVINNAERLVKLDVAGEQCQAMVKEIQYEPVSRLVSHVDFQEISATEKITLEVPIRARGKPAGANEGGVLGVVMHAISVEARAADVPEEIRVDVSAMNIGDVIRAGEIQLPEGLKLVTEENATVLAVERPRSEEDSEAQVDVTEGAAGPEVLTAKKEGEEEAAEAPPVEEEKKPEASG